MDKQLYDIKAVQTLSRLNRACPKKYDTFVLDFFNDPNDIIESFSRYYKTTLLSGETDPNKLYDLIADMESYQVFAMSTSSSWSTVIWTAQTATNLTLLSMPAHPCTSSSTQMDRSSSRVRQRALCAPTAS